MNKIELLAPAKDLQKAKIAILYGADAVYVGGLNYSLRSRASNFTNADIKEACEFAHLHHAKLFVTVNIVFHDADYQGIEEYLNELDSYKVDAVIISSVGLLAFIKQHNYHFECHMSTQLSTANSKAITVFKNWQADRVVLARECSIKQITEITKKSTLPVEVFIHGGMCSNYSGRCVLSNRMTLRDANRGGCAHSCRWNYQVYQNDKLISLNDCPFSMSSKDLKATSYLKKMIDCGVSSLKIEGRMKSEYYIAQVVKTYRKMIDEIYENKEINQEKIDYYNNELLKAENRPSDDGFLSGDCNNSKQIYGINGEGVTNEYVGLVKDYQNNKALIEVKNKFMINDILEVFGPQIDNYQFKVQNIKNLNEEEIIIANNPQELLWLEIDVKLHKDDMIRKISRNTNEN